MSVAARRIDHVESIKAEGVYLRRIIRRNKGKALTNSEIKVLVSLVNLWLHHRNGTKGFIHPGRDAIAKKNHINSKTVSRALGKLRGMHIAVPVKHLQGGNGRSTQYRIDTDRLKAVFDPSRVTAREGKLIKFCGTNDKPKCPATNHQNVPQQPGQNVPLSLRTVGPSKNQEESEAQFVNPFADIGDRDLLRNGRASLSGIASHSKPATYEIQKTRMKGSAT